MWALQVAGKAKIRTEARKAGPQELTCHSKTGDVNAKRTLPNMVGDKFWASRVNQFRLTTLVHVCSMKLSVMPAM